MSNDEALDKLISDAMETEKGLAVREEQLALQSKQFAEYLKEKKHQDEQLEVLWTMVKEEMESRGLTEHEVPGVIQLKLTPSGKYRLAEGVDIDSIPDSLCVVKKSLDNKKVKASIALNGVIPKGVESTGNVLRKKIL